MKLIATVLLLMTGLSVCYSQSNGQADSEFDDFTKRWAINDTICDIIDGKDFLCFTVGHNGHIWSIAFVNDNDYIILSGSTRENSSHIDTIPAPVPVLRWGIDSLAVQAREMPTAKNDYFWNIFEQLILFSADKEKLFEWTNSFHFCGKNSEEFNNNFKKLLYFMLWMAFPTDRKELLPEPEIYLYYHELPI